MSHSSSDLQKQIVGVFRANKTALFAGAGVSAQAGLPVWAAYLEHLAAVAEEFEPLVARLMRKRIASGLYLDAAQYYKTCKEVPQGKKLDELVKPLADEKLDSRRLDGLCALPFTLAITTNYDRGLHHSFARMRGLSPLCAELHDPTLRQSLYWRDFYVARIHGRIEVPQSIVLDSDDYKAVYAETDYQDLLRAALVRHSLLFVGFSFLDPAIEEVLEFVRTKGIQPSLHHALVPTGQPGFVEKLAQYNIKAIEYEPGEHHQNLWHALTNAAEELRQASPSSVTVPSHAFDTAKRLLAVCYARASVGSEVEALRLIVVEGILLSELAAGTTSTTELATRLRTYMALTAMEARNLVDAGIETLIRKNICLQDGDAVVLVNDITTKVSPVGPLVEGVIARASLRGSFAISETIRSSLASVVEEVIVLRGFDLGAEFSGANLGDDPDISDTVKRAIDRHLPNEWHDKKAALADAFVDLVRHPDRREETVLGELGRLSFGIELLLQSGRTAIYGSVLPEVIYLDTNVILPALVPGHPNRKAYLSAIRELQDGAQKSGGVFSVHISDVVLNEMVSHRRKAIEIVKQEGLEDPATLEKRVLFFGATAFNVYIGGYAGWIRDPENRGKKFADFLGQIAPYKSEAELKSYLVERGITVVATITRTTDEATEQQTINDSLFEGYAKLERGLDWDDRKLEILKRHEAAQIHLLRRDLCSGKRPVFVTADAKLRRAVAGSDLAQLRDILISPQNLIQLVDLVIGMDVPPASLTRLLWSVKMADDKAVIKDYLIHRAMPHYDAALLLKLGDVLEGYADKVVRDATLQKVDLNPTTFEARLATSRFMDRVEEELFLNLAPEVQKLKSKLRDIERADWINN